MFIVILFSVKLRDKPRRVHPDAMTTRRSVSQTAERGGATSTSSKSTADGRYDKRTEKRAHTPLLAHNTIYLCSRLLDSPTRAHNA